MNAFDFYSVQVSSPRKGDLKRAGVPVTKISAVPDGFKSYGSRRFPRWRYVASVAFCDATADPEPLAAPWRGKGLLVAVRYIARD